MDRVKPGGFSAAIEAAYQVIPERFHFLKPDFLCSVDPVFVGPHSYLDASYGRSYGDTAHCVYPYHQWQMPKTRCRTTIVLPAVEEV